MAADNSSNPLTFIINQQRGNMTQQNNKPDWIEYDKETGKAKGVSAARLGEYVYSLNRAKWLLVADGKENEFWVYRDLARKVANTSHTVVQKVWQPACLDVVRAEVHKQLKHYNLWTAKREKDATTYISGELLTNIKEKSETVGAINPHEVLALDGVLRFDEKGNITVVENSPAAYFTDFVTYKVKDIKKAPETDRWFQETFGTSALTVKQYIGYMFFTTYKYFQAYIILVAPGGDGKSTTINYINSLLPESEVSHISLQALTASEKSSKNFSLSGLRNKRLNSRNDITDDFIQDASMLKTLTGNDPIYASVKFHEDTSFINHAKLIFACNSLPEFRDTSKGFNRRAYIITTHGINGFSKKYDMKAILQERGAFIKECIKAFCDRMQDQAKKADAKEWQLYRDKQTIANSVEWSVSNDQVQQFLDECAYPQSEAKGEKRALDTTYFAYVNWTKNSGVKPLGKKKFNDQLREKGFKDHRTTRKGRSFRYWENLKLYSDSGNITQI
jgi:putative DNA primase/helicase